MRCPHHTKHAPHLEHVLEGVRSIWIAPSRMESSESAECISGLQDIPNIIYMHVRSWPWWFHIDTAVPLHTFPTDSGIIRCRAIPDGGAEGLHICIRGTNSYPIPSKWTARGPSILNESHCGYKWNILGLEFGRSRGWRHTYWTRKRISSEIPNSDESPEPEESCWGH